MDNWKPGLLVGLYIFIVFFIISGLTYVNFRFAQGNPGGNDFLARWMGAYYWIQKGISPYDKQVSIATQNAFYGHSADPRKGEDIAHFVYPFTSMVFFAPFGLLNYTFARAIWMTILELCLFFLAIICVQLSQWSVSLIETTLLILFSLFWYHGLRIVILGQFAGIEALLIALVILIIQRNKDFGAGLLLALCTTKPQMIFLLLPYIIIWAIIKRRWKLVWGTFVGSGVLMGVSLVLIPDWPFQMLRQIFEYPTYTRIGSPVTIIANIAPGISQQLNWGLNIFFVVYLLVEWVISFQKDEKLFLWTSLLTLVITNLIAFRTATTNYVVLLPVLFLIFRVFVERWRWWGKFAVWISILVIGIGLWLLFLHTVQGNQEQAIMYLPLPLYCLFGLWWIKWWVINPPRVLFDNLDSRIIE